ncbi:glutathione S-transferase family protein (plasmid) [Bosea vestrisii]|uniref:glutathione S-transferase family protein n=1 Tax=Bosea vestrisii TaxID=151416 RepID=UPI0024DFD8EF|nr:glutathione S-transferase family protein [Bosea vestrisii]WID99828.1 glutathione S-transferase family protein [Bosea vestrisii]
MQQTGPLRLYDTQRSGNAWKVRLLAGYIGQPLERSTLSIDKGDLETPEFRAIARFRQVPVLEMPDGRRIAESGAILFFLAQGTDWWPKDPLEQADVLSWMSFEQSSHMHPLAQLRLHRALHPDRNVERSKVEEWESKANGALAVLEERLSQVEEGDWLATHSQPSIADIALYPYTRMAGMGGIELDNKPGVSNWLKRVESLPGYSALFPGRAELNESVVEG